MQISSVGSGGNVTLHNGSTGTVHVIADVLGYFAGGGAASIPGSFQANVPNRVLDTRVASDVTAGAAVGHGREVSLKVTGSHPSSTGAPVVVPEDASAVVLNVTAVAPTEAGYVTAYPNGSARPLASNVNFARETTAVPNLVTVKVGDAGKVNLYVGTDPDPVNGKVHLIADIVGCYVGGEATQPGTFVPLTPKRILDSRDGAGMVAKLGITPLARRVNNYETIALDVAGSLDQPPHGRGGRGHERHGRQPDGDRARHHLPRWPSRPVVSSLNYVAWRTVPNLVTVRRDNGKVDFYTFSAGQTDLIADVAGFYRSDPFQRSRLGLGHERDRPVRPTSRWASVWRRWASRPGPSSMPCAAVRMPSPPPTSGPRASWLAVTGVALAVGFVTFTSIVGMLGLLAVIAAGVYLADVKPALDRVMGKGRSDGPYGPW